MRVVGIGWWRAALVALAFHAAPAVAATIPFTEEFAASDSLWRANSNLENSLTWSASGGVDGSSYVSGTFNFVSSTAGAQGPVLFRGPGVASGGAFVGNWLTEGVLEMSFYVRHDAGVPVNFFARFASPFGFPGAIAASFAPTQSLPVGDWTKITFAITPSNPAFVSFEGSSFDTVFSNVGIVQVGASIPTPLAGVDQVVHFDLDRVSIRGVPEPSGAALLVLGLGIAGLARSHKRRQ